MVVSSVRSSSVYTCPIHIRRHQNFQILQILKCLKDPKCAIFLKSMGFNDIKYDIPVHQMWNTQIRKYKVLRRPKMCYNFEKPVIQGYQLWSSHHHINLTERTVVLWMPFFVGCEVKHWIHNATHYWISIICSLQQTNAPSDRQLLQLFELKLSIMNKGC